MISMETENDTSKMLLTVSSFGESLRRFSTGGGVLYYGEYDRRLGWPAAMLH
jgi:hypothetical protein